MNKNDFLKMTVVSLAAMTCFSGQAPRKQVQEVPANEEVYQDIPLQNIPANKQRKSAAQKARELEESGNTTMVERKGAAKRAMEEIPEKE